MPRRQHSSILTLGSDASDALWALVIIGGFRILFGNGDDSPSFMNRTPHHQSLLPETRTMDEEDQDRD
jgi:hypothetical protein